MSTDISRIAAAVIAIASTGAVVSAQDFVQLGVLPGRLHTRVRGISADGTTVVGVCDANNNFQFPPRAFRWTQTTGLVDLGNVDNSVGGAAYAASASGGAIVGDVVYPSQSGFGSGFIWSASDPSPQVLTFLSGGGLYSARGINSDGTTIVGTTLLPVPEQSSYQICAGWRDAAGAVHPLGTLAGTPPQAGIYTSGATSVSGDGLVIVGESNTNTPQRWWHPFRWQGGIMVDLGTLNAQGVGSSGILPATNRDGSVVVGSEYGVGPTRAWRWTAVQGMVELPTLANSHTLARAVSGSGRVAGGYSIGVNGTSRGVLWIEGRGIFDVNTLLPSLGVAIPAGWTLHEVNAISDDGRAIAGGGSGPAGQFLGWLVTGLPCSFTCPADANCSGTLTVQDIFDFLAAYFSGSPAGDFNGAGGATVQDIFDFLAAYFAGCA